ncbi:MAG: class I SAM-dependent methyltransferase [Planctomycetota bacterium]|nr:class I SAM-dependent methyltransferase [Planctomycetota bacterium]
MNLLDIIERSPEPTPWTEGDNIPWHDPAFSERMMAEHLSQSHDMASRRGATIDKHVRWIHSELLVGQPSRILDLGCGPGLYTSRLSKLGHDCVGIDYSPASIRHAKDQAKQENLSCEYMLQDIREADFGSGFDVAMMIFGEFNVFRPSDAKAILEKARAALNDNGLLLLEAHALAAIEKIGRQDRSWYSTESGLFSDKPHLCLQENFWDADNKTATTRYFIIDSATGDVTRHAATYQGYSDEQYRSLLAETGFDDVRFFSSLAGEEDVTQADLIAITARKAQGKANGKPI